MSLDPSGVAPARMDARQRLILEAVRACRHMRSVGSKSPAPLLPRRAAAASKPRKIERQSSPSSASSSDDSAATLVDAAAITQQVRACPC